MTIPFSRKNDASSGARTILALKNLVLPIVFVLEYKGLHSIDCTVYNFSRSSSRDHSRA